MRLSTYVNTPGSDSVSSQPLESSSDMTVQSTTGNARQTDEQTRHSHVTICLAKALDPNKVESFMSTTAIVESPPPVTDARAANRERFELELEFVQSLANPYYLHSLAQQNILDQPAFVNYLEYLQYWREKDYARFIQSVWSGPCFDTDRTFSKLSSCSAPSGAASACSF